uniref:Uncharacterized protein n=2 Tax=Bracon brevicornis TaxID=1563983 RepID=A0A6V7JGD4_9HYME
MSLGEAKTDVDEKRRLRLADPARLSALKTLQRFDTAEWKEVRYSKTLSNFLATPGFTELKVNEDLIPFKKKDTLAHIDHFLGGLCNAVLEERHLLRKGLQEVVDWASSNPQQLTPESLADKLQSTLGPDSELTKTLNQILQIICGKRAETINSRRERLLEEIPVRTSRAALRDVPPSAEFLFGKENVQSLAKTVSGTSTWLGRPKRSQEPTRPALTTLSTRSAGPREQPLRRSAFHQRPRERPSYQRDNSRPKPTGKKEQNNKPGSFFRRKQDKQ